MKKILGLDLGTNSIGWAITELDFEQKIGNIIGLGSRIIPMDQAKLGDFEKGNKVSQTADRTGYRGVRRLLERAHLRRERLHRVLNILGFLPEHYSACIDFENRLGKFVDFSEPKIAYKTNLLTGKNEFMFQKSFDEMLKDFEINQPDSVENGKKVPYDWTIYFLRKKALTQRIEKEELAWILLNFNQKRGYYQLRGEEEEENKNKLVEFHSLLVVRVEDSGDKKGKDEVWYNVHLENGWIYRRTSKIPLDWVGKTKDFIVTTDLNDDGSVKADKDGKEKRSFRAPAEDDWTLVKKKTEFDIENSKKSIGAYIYDTLLLNPNQKIKGKLVRTIERKYYKSELQDILAKQQEFHPELQSKDLLRKCVEELYRINEAHRDTILKKDFVHLFLNDIILYQRPLKTKKSLISNCPFEMRFYKDSNGEVQTESIKCIAKSHPLFQEFRLWQFVKNLKLYQKEKLVDGALKTDVDITREFLKTEDDVVALFDWLNDRKEIKQDMLFSSYFKMKVKKGESSLYRWNFVEDKEYPCNETRNSMLSRMAKAGIENCFLNKENEEALWHILYSVEDKLEIVKALESFASKHKLDGSFVESFRKYPSFPKDYGAYSAKAIKKMLPLMRVGKYWNESDLDVSRVRIEKIITGEYDEKIRNRVREKTLNLTKIEDFRGLPLWLTSYIVYDRHSESGEILKWETPNDIDLFLKNKFQQHSLRNPIVEQVITETLRVVKDIWQTYGAGEKSFFDEIHIELGREMKNPADKRKQMTSKITENENTNIRIKSLLIELMNCGEIDNVRPYSPSQQEILKLYEDGVLNSEVEIPEDILKISKMAQPSKSELLKYKLWIEQKYKSPYTGNIIPLSKLFTPAYEIEHIIPQSRFFDDSFTNKVICEAEVNKDKDNALAYEYISNNRGKKIELSENKMVTIFTVEAYEEFVKTHYAKNRAKMKKLLLNEIPDSFSQSQLNDSRFISKVVKSLLSNIVRTDDEQEDTSKNVISSNGAITSILKQDWGLNDVWNDIVTPRFDRLNQLTNSENFGEWVNRGGSRFFQTQVPFELQKGFNKKRIDHRHHALDALVIACATRSHINYLNNDFAKPDKSDLRFDLRNKLRRLESIQIEKIENGEKIKKTIKVAKEFHKPWSTFTQDTRGKLETTLVSFKQNLRVINKTVNKYQHFENGKKVTATQTKGDSWAIRKPMHKETVSGKVKIRFKKTVQLSMALDVWQSIVDKSLKNQIKVLVNQGFDKVKLVKFFKEIEYKWNEKDISKIEIYYFNDECAASRTKIDESFNSKAIESVTDSGIKQILNRHLEKYESAELAFSSDGLEQMNLNIVELNNGVFHKPIYKVRTFEPIGNKFAVGQTGNKKDKFVEAAKGTNLFFAIYVNLEGKRTYETIPLNIVIERQKQGLSSAPEKNEKGDNLLFILSPNDLVYVPTKDEIENYSLVDFSRMSNVQVQRIYKVEKTSGIECYFIRNDISFLIKQYDAKSKFGELESQNKLQTTMCADRMKISDYCWKLTVNRLGQIIKVNR